MVQLAAINMIIPLGALHTQETNAQNAPKMYPYWYVSTQQAGRQPACQPASQPARKLRNEIVVWALIIQYIAFGATHIG
jgi:hypothetical protein